MYIRDIFEKRNPVLSFEVFPPKKAANIDTVKKTIDELSDLPVDYMSVTYGAGGTTASNTAEIADYLQNTKNITALAHLTCISSEKDKIEGTLAELSALNVENILALRGDFPQNNEYPVSTTYRYASQLVGDIKKFGKFCIGGACYPECHPDSRSLDEDIDNLKIKVDSGCDFLVTQMFFDPDAFYRFRDKCTQKRINIPITAGIMPLTNEKQIKKMCVLSGGASMPAKFTRMIAKYLDKPDALKQAGIAYAVDMIAELVSNDTRGIHLYTMNKSDVAHSIVSVINNLF